MGKARFCLLAVAATVGAADAKTVKVSSTLSNTISSASLSIAARMNAVESVGS